MFGCGSLCSRGARLKPRRGLTLFAGLASLGGLTLFAGLGMRLVGAHFVRWGSAKASLVIVRGTRAIR